jgi:hypothetical protein
VANDGWITRTARLSTQNQNNKKQIMKHSLQYILILFALVALVFGCSTTGSTENLLSAAGFKIIPATTAQQQAHLKTLKPDKVTRVERNGTNYFVFPDEKRQVLYVGHDAQFQEYQKLRLQKQMAEQQVEAAEINQENWYGWGAWGPGIWGP